KTARLAELLRRLRPGEVRVAIGFLTGWPRQGKLGVGWSAVSDSRAHPPAPEATLELVDVDRAFDAIAGTKGKNSATRRWQLIRELFQRAREDEQQFLGALLVGEVRQGALEGVLLEAIAKAASVRSDRLRRA